MHAHKPKSIHSWREFATEIVVIVIGILIALSLEQLVENWHEHRQYAEARQAMRDELSNNMTNMLRRDRFAACTQGRIKDIGAILDRAENGQPFAAPSWIGPIISYRPRFAAESESGKSTLFSSAEQRSFGSPYSYFHSLDAEQDRERLAWGRLRMLEGKNHLTPEMIQSLREALADARYENYRIAYLMVWAKGFSKQIGLKDLSGQAYYTMPLFKQHPHCLPMDMPAAQAARESELKPVFY